MLADLGHPGVRSWYGCRRSAAPVVDPTDAEILEAWGAHQLEMLIATLICLSSGPVLRASGRPFTPRRKESVPSSWSARRSAAKPE